METEVFKNLYYFPVSFDNKLIRKPVHLNDVLEDIKFYYMYGREEGASWPKYLPISISHANRILYKKKRQRQSYLKNVKMSLSRLHINTVEITQSPISKTCYVDIGSCKIRVSDHKLNDYNTMPLGVKMDIYSVNGEFMISKIRIKMYLGI